MTRNEAIDQAPNTRGTYWSSLVLASLGILVFCGLPLFGMRMSVWLVAGAELMGMVMFALAAQCWERLFRPERAAERSASLSDRQRLWISRLRTFLVVGFAAIMVVAVVLFCLSKEQQRISSDLRIFVWAPYMLASILADLQGERVGIARVGRRVGAGSIQKTLAPLQSEHWGERG